MNSNEHIDSIIDRLTTLVRPHLRFLEHGRAIELDEPLADAGLDSMGAIELLAGIEDRFGISIPDDLLNEETFATLRSLSALVQAVQKR